MAAFNNNTAQLDLNLTSIGQAFNDNDPATMLPQTLAQFGFATAGMATYAAMYRRPSVNELAYFLGVGVAFVAGVADVWPALWVSHNAAGRRGKGKIILCASVAPLVLAVGLGGFAVNFKN